MNSMFFRGRVRPSKSMSAFGMIVGGIFVLLGIFVIIPTFGAFGLLWTAIAGGIAVMQGLNVFSNKGPGWELEAKTPMMGTVGRNDKGVDFEEKLRKLQTLKEDGLLTQEEYDRKRSEIINDKW